MWTRLGTLGLTALLTGCKLTVISTEGGDINFVDRYGACTGGNTCTEVVDTARFNLTLEAVPRVGYTFHQWKSGDGFLCGGSTNPVCVLELNGGALAQAIADQHDTYFVMPLYNYVGADTDGDGISNDLDPDDDGDGTPDAEDPCPLDPNPACQPPKIFEDVVSASYDDAEENVGNGDMTRASSDLDLYGGGFTTNIRRVIGLHFDNSTIPAGATVLSAHIVLTADSQGTGNEMELLITAEPHDSSDGSAAFDSEDFELTSRLRTFPIPWELTPDFLPGQKLYSPDIREIVQEVVDHPEWQGLEDDMTFFIEAAPWDTSFGHQEVYSQDGAPSTAERPFLYIEYQEAF